MRVLPILVLLAAGLAAYAGSLSGPFVFDDEPSIVNNSHLRQLWPLQRSATAPPETTAAGRPVVCLSLAIDYALHGLEVTGYHVFNLAVHLAAALLLFGVVRRTLATRIEETRVAGLAFAAALLWLLHPLQTQCVTYVIQRAEGLASLFALLTLYAAIRAHGSARPRAWTAVAVLACALAMGSKENAVGLPLLVWLHDRVFFHASWRESLRARPALFAGLAAAWVLLALLVAGAPRAETAGFGRNEVSPLEYAWTQANVIPHYLRLAFWPDPLVLDYGWPLARSWGEAWPGGAWVLGLLAATVWALRYRPGLGFAGACFFVWLAPTSSFMPIDDPAMEHRMYLPLAPLLVLVVLAAERALRVYGTTDARRRVAAGLLLAVVATGFALRTVRRNQDYGDAITLWAVTAAQRPAHPRPAVHLAAALARAGRWAEAAEKYEAVLHDHPGDYHAQVGLGWIRCRQGDAARGTALLEAAAKRIPEYPFAWFFLGQTLRRTDPERATACLTEAVRAAPHLAEAWVELGQAQRARRREAEAEAAFERALALDPGLPLAHAALGAMCEESGRLADARRHYRAAMVPWESQAEVATALAWLLATDPEGGDPAEALRLAEFATRGAGAADPARLDTLAAAHAAAGQTRRAEAVARDAAARAAALGYEAYARRIRARADLYATGAAYRGRR